MKKFYGFDTDTMANGGKGLTFEEEKELSKKILAGNEARIGLLSGAVVTETGREELTRLAEEGDAACKALVAANYPRAMKTALSTWRRNSSGIYDFEDYLQIALEVVIKAARTFDWRHGCRFSTWVYPQLRQAMIRENAASAYALRIPEENLYKLGKLKRLTENGSLAEAAGTMDMTENAAGKLLAAGSVYQSLQDPFSAEDSDTELGEMIADSHALTGEEIEEKIDRETDWRKILMAFPKLSEEEQSLLKARMGFGGDVPLRACVGIYGKSISGVQKKQIAAEKHLRELVSELPLACCRPCPRGFFRAAPKKKRTALFFSVCSPNQTHSCDRILSIK